MPGTVPFLEKVPNYEVREGNMHIWSDDWAVCMSLRTFRLGMARAAKAIATYEAKKADVVPIKRRGRGHAA